MTEERKETSYTDYVSIGLHYLQTQKYYLIFNVIIAIILIITQAINWYFIINVPNNVRPPPLDVHTPLIILIVISIILVIYIIYFTRFLVQLTKYKKLELSNEETQGTNDELENPEAILGESTSITETIYILNDMVNKLQLLFILTLVMSFVYLIWFVRYFIQDLSILQIVTLSSPPPPPQPGHPFLPPPPPNTRIFNYVTVIALFLFLLINLRYFLKWHRKFSKLSQLEKQIYDELDLDSL